MTKEKLTYLKRDETDREGNALKTRDGRPYTRLSIRVDSQGDRFISGFENAQTKNWKINDEVEIEIVESDKKDKNGKPYLNFRIPKVEDKNAEMLIKLSMQIGGLQNDVRRILDRMDGKKETHYTTPEEEGISLDEAPF